MGVIERGDHAIRLCDHLRPAWHGPRGVHMRAPSNLMRIPFFRAAQAAPTVAPLAAVGEGVCCTGA